MTGKFQICLASLNPFPDLARPRPKAPWARAWRLRSASFRHSASVPVRRSRQPEFRSARPNLLPRREPDSFEQFASRLDDDSHNHGMFRYAGSDADPEHRRGHIMKIGIIGAGAVGAVCAMATNMRGCASELVLVNRGRDRAKGMAADVGAPLSSTTRVTDGDYSDLAGAALIIVTVGVNEKSGGATDRSDPLGRLRLLDNNSEVRSYR